MQAKAVHKQQFCSFDSARRRILQLAILSATSGCASPFHRQRAIHTPVAAPVAISSTDMNVEQPTTRQTVDSKVVEVLPVAFTQSSSRKSNEVISDVANLQPPTQPVTPQHAMAQPATTQAAMTQAVMTQAVMTLADFESMAMSCNPTIQQLTAIAQKAAGFRQQVGMRANPVVGYQAVQLADKQTDQHTAFVEQEFVTGGKLGLNKRVMNEAVRAQMFEIEAQKYRVQTDVRIKFYAALAAQQQVALTSEFQQVGKTGFELAELRKKAMEASQIEVLQAKIQMHQIDLIKQQAEVQYAAAWRELAALVGTPDLPPARLDGQFETQVQTIDWESTRSTIFASSPEYMAAQTRVRQAQINLERQGVQAIPNLTVQMAGGVDNGTNSGLINLQVGAPIPVFNKNHGNIVAARAEYCRALMEVRRIENSIQARLAAVSNDFDSARAAVVKYDSEILPSARETLSLAEQAYKAGEFSFLEVLIVRRTYFESNLQMLQSQTQLAQASAKAHGFLLTGGLDSVVDLSGDDSLRGQTFSQQ